MASAPRLRPPQRRGACHFAPPAGPATCYGFTCESLSHTQGFVCSELEGAPASPSPTTPVTSQDLAVTSRSSPHGLAVISP